MPRSARDARRSGLRTGHYGEISSLDPGAAPRRALALGESQAGRRAGPGPVCCLSTHEAIAAVFSRPARPAFVGSG